MPVEADHEIEIWLAHMTTTPAAQPVYYFNNTSWEPHTFTFTSPANDDEVNLQVGHLYFAVNNGYTHYDNVVIRRTGDTW